MQFNNTKFSKAITAKRKKDGETKNGLALLLKMERVNIIRYESGTTPSLEPFARICKWLNADMESFFTSK